MRAHLTGLVAAASLAAACSSPTNHAGGGGGSDGSDGLPGGSAGDDDAGAGADLGADRFTQPALPAGVWSDSVVGIPGNELLTGPGPFLNTYRTFVKPGAAGATQWVFWMSNATDSTFGPGPPQPNLLGGTWRIESATVGDGGTTRTGVVAGTLVPVTFAGTLDKTVTPGESFASDPVAITLPPDHYLAFTWTLSADAGGPSIPSTSVPFLTSFFAVGKDLSRQESNAGFSVSTDRLVAPQLFASDRPVTNRLCFLGDSITQGIGSTRDSYGYWVAKIAAGLGDGAGVWNLGSGWARAADAASDGYWLWKAKQCTEVAVILGVNDIINSQRSAQQILADLTTILVTLKAQDPVIKTILFTVPTFNLGGDAYTTWKQVNDTIRSSQPPAGADRVFDIAAVESQPAPNDGLVRPEFVNGGDGHPNDVAGTAIATAFLSWYAAP